MLWICWHRISTAGRKTSVLKICRWSLRIHRALQHQIWPLVIRSKREVCDGWQLQDNNEDEDEDGNEDHVHEGGDEDDEYWEIEEDEDDEGISYYGMTMMMMMGIMIMLMTPCSWTLGNRGTFFLVVLSSDPAVVYMWLILLILPFFGSFFRIHGLTPGFLLVWGSFSPTPLTHLRGCPSVFAQFSRLKGGISALTLWDGILPFGTDIHSSKEMIVIVAIGRIADKRGMFIGRCAYECQWSVGG